MVALPMRCFWTPLIVQSSSQTNELAKDSALVFAYGSIRRNDFHWFCGHGSGTRSFWSESVQTCKRKPLCKVFAQSGLGFGHSLSKYSKCIKRISQIQQLRIDSKALWCTSRPLSLPRAYCQIILCCQDMSRLYFLKHKHQKTNPANLEMCVNVLRTFSSIFHIPFSKSKMRMPYIERDASLSPSFRPR